VVGTVVEVGLEVGAQEFGGVVVGADHGALGSEGVGGGKVVSEEGEVALREGEVAALLRELEERVVPD
jgi:hypothetical protein